MTVGRTPVERASELRAAALVLEQAAELAGTLDELRLRLEHGDVDALRRLLAGPLLVAARGTLERVAGPELAEVAS